MCWISALKKTHQGELAFVRGPDMRTSSIALERLSARGTESRALCARSSAFLTDWSGGSSGYCGRGCLLLVCGVGDWSHAICSDRQRILEPGNVFSYDPVRLLCG